MSTASEKFAKDFIQSDPIVCKYYVMYSYSMYEMARIILDAIIREQALHFPVKNRSKHQIWRNLVFKSTNCGHRMTLHHCLATTLLSIIKPMITASVEISFDVMSSSRAIMSINLGARHYFKTILPVYIQIHSYSCSKWKYVKRFRMTKKTQEVVLFF